MTGSKKGRGACFECSLSRMANTIGLFTRTTADVVDGWVTRTILSSSLAEQGTLEASGLRKGSPACATRQPLRMPRRRELLDIMGILIEKSS